MVLVGVGVAFIVFWGLVEVFAITVTKSALVTGIVFILLGLVLGERPWNRP